MRIFNGFLIMLCSVILWFLPITESIYAWQTDQRTDKFNVTTAPGQTTASIILHKPIFDDDTNTISFSSNVSEVPTCSSYNATTRQVLVATLLDDTTRELDVSYDVSAFDWSPTLDTVGDIAIWLYYILLALFPMAGVVYIFWGKLRGEE